MERTDSGLSLSPFLRSVTRKLLLLLLVTTTWFSFSICISAMLSTAALPTPEAQGVVENLKTNNTNCLWGLVIPVTFVLVIATRPKR